MFREYLIIFLLGHILGDFYVQTERTAERKDSSFIWVLIHCGQYYGVMLIMVLFIASFDLVLGATLASLLHLIIDAMKFVWISSMYNKDNLSKTTERNIFFVDQFLHFVSLFGISYWQAKNSILIEGNVITDFLNLVGIQWSTAVSWIFALLFIHKPANIAIQKLLAVYRPISNINNMQETISAGRFIGTVERMIMLIFLSIKQYSAIGLVLTAKSIARYDKISKEKDFAEYYLLGTLLSTLIVIIISLVFIT
ncbi:MAG TPA: DUF3307 domain-containing protein [Tissierellia bacterium]|nr:DUF3307 domain-containing protein [Tissierellia bacterium]